MRKLLVLLALLFLASPAEAYRAVTACPGTSALYSNNATSVEPLVDLNGNTCVSDGMTAGQLPSGATAVTISATGTTAAVAAALPAPGAGVTNYICGFSVRSNATAAITGNITLAGVIVGTMNFTHWTAPLASGIGTTEQTFYPCIPASAANGAITVTGPAAGAGGVHSVSAWGYKK